MLINCYKHWASIAWESMRTRSWVKDCSSILGISNFGVSTGVMVLTSKERYCLWFRKTRAHVQFSTQATPMSCKKDLYPYAHLNGISHEVEINVGSEPTPTWIKDKNRWRLLKTPQKALDNDPNSLVESYYLEEALTGDWVNYIEWITYHQSIN